MSAKRLILLRHGRTASNAENRFQGHLDVALDEVGHAQAAAAAVHLAKRLSDAAARGEVRVVSSDLSRASATAEPLARALGLEPTLDAALRERDGGTWQGLLHTEIESRHAEEFARWMAGEDLVIGGGESLGQAWLRCEGGIRRHAEAMDGGTLVVVSHGASMRGGMLRLLGVIGEPGSASASARDLEIYRAFQGFGNAHWAVVGRRRAAAGDRWVLRRYNLSAPDAPAS